MPLDATRNGLVLPLLGLLVEQPAHAYALTTRLTGRYPQLSATRSTVTTLLRSLAGAGLLRGSTPERVGNRPPRTAYQLTAAGVAHFRLRVEEDLTAAQVASTGFVTALAYVGILPATRAVTILQARSGRLRSEEAALPDDPIGVPEIHMIEVAYWRHLLTAEADWTATLAARIRAGDLAWPSGPTSAEATS